MGRTRSQKFQGSFSLTNRTQAWVEFLLISAFAPSLRPSAWKALGYTPHSHKHRPCFYTPRRCEPLRRKSLCLKSGRRAPAWCTTLGWAPSLITQTVSGFLSSSPPPAPFPLPLPLPSPNRPPAPPPPSLGSRDGGAVRQAQPPAPMAARRSQRRRGRRGEPGTALLAPLVLGLGLALACLGLLLAVVSLGSRASSSAQVRPCCTPLPGQVRSRVCEAADGTGWAEGKGPGRWVEGEMSGGKGRGDAASFPAGAFPGGTGGRGGPGPSGEWVWLLIAG